MIAVNSVIN